MRPLIVKVDNHKVESNTKAIGSINLNLIRASNTDNSTYDEEKIIPNDVVDKNGEGLTSISLVRNLISRYEHPKTDVLLKCRSKSMIDLQKPKVPVAPTTQDDHLYNRSQYDDKEETFDFKKVLMMFQSIDKSVPVNNSTSKQSKIFNYTKKEDTQFDDFDNSTSKQSKIFNYTKKEDTKFDDFDLGMIKQKATMLLHDKPNLESFNNASYWQKQVLELLEQISGVQTSNFTISSNSSKFNYKENKRQLSDGELFTSNYGEDETDFKQRKLEGDSKRSSSVKDIRKYFESNSAEKYIPYNEYAKQDVEEFEELDSSSDSTDSFNTVQLASPTHFLNRFLEEDKKFHVFDLDNLKSLVDDLIKEVHYYEELIENITSDETQEIADMNDALYNILLKLENIKAYGDEELLNKRKDAIHFVQTCTAQLKTKIRN